MAASWDLPVWPSTRRRSTYGTTPLPARNAGSLRADEGRELDVADKNYDFVIVGGGSAGCALANRLSADPGTSVLVLEAGRSDFKIDPFIHMPAALPIPIGNPLYDWRYESEPEPHMGGRKIF